MIVIEIPMGVLAASFFLTGEKKKKKRKRKRKRKEPLHAGQWFKSTVQICLSQQIFPATCKPKITPIILFNKKNLNV
jgi:hypothetical protein